MTWTWLNELQVEALTRVRERGHRYEIDRRVAKALLRRGLIERAEIGVGFAITTDGIMYLIGHDDGVAHRRRAVGGTRR